MVSRRQVLTAGSLVLAGTAGCLDTFDATETDDSDGSESPSDDSDENTSLDSDDSTSSDSDDGTESDSGESIDPDTPLVTVVENVDATDETESDDEPADDGSGPADEELVLATYGDVVDHSDVTFDEHHGHYYVPITFSAAAADEFVATLESIDAFEAPEEQQITTYAGDDAIDTYSLGPSLADAMESGDWNGSFQLMSNEESELDELVAALEE
ncbi:hypothetical protein ACLI4Z_07800 [Natrialbaceae archaeon A-arb3/5]